MKVFRFFECPTVIETIIPHTRRGGPGSAASRRSGKIPPKMNEGKGERVPRFQLRFNDEMGATP